jgi:hypothetical protein
MFRVWLIRVVVFAACVALGVGVASLPGLWRLVILLAFIFGGITYALIKMMRKT